MFSFVKSYVTVRRKMCLSVDLFKHFMSKVRQSLHNSLNVPKPTVISKAPTCPVVMTFSGSDVKMDQIGDLKTGTVTTAPN